MTTSKQNIAIRVPSSLISELDRLAKAVHRSRAWLGEEAIRQYVKLQRWHLREITAGVSDLKAGRVVQHDKVALWLESWGRSNESNPPAA